nr:hypothetical protein [Tanacetum cinerariifolium]
MTKIYLLETGLSSSSNPVYGRIVGTRDCNPNLKVKNDFDDEVGMVTYVVNYFYLDDSLLVGSPPDVPSSDIVSFLVEEEEVDKVRSPPDVPSSDIVSFLVEEEEVDK